MTIRELVEKCEQANHPGKKHFPFRMLAGRFRDKVGEATEISPENALEFFLFAKEELQHIGHVQEMGDDDFDKSMWEELTSVLDLVRTVLIQEFRAELPEARVVGMAQEMIEVGMLTATKGKDGKTYVKPNEGDPYTLKIKITKTPAGPAPEDFRKLWVGMELPARRGVPGHDVERPPLTSRSSYVVPYDRALVLLREKSVGAVDWFVGHFGIPQPGINLFFGADEAEVVS